MHSRGPHGFAGDVRQTGGAQTRGICRWAVLNGSREVDSQALANALYEGCPTRLLILRRHARQETAVCKPPPPKPQRRTRFHSLLVCSRCSHISSSWLYLGGGGIGKGEIWQSKIVPNCAMVFKDRINSNYQKPPANNSGPQPYFLNTNA